MAAVTEEIVSNLLKSNLTNLHSFAELLNAEFTEEGHGEEDREKYKEDISRVLEKFGSSEAGFLKQVRCLNQTKNDVYGTIGGEEGECDRQQLMKDIDEIVNIIEGRSKIADNEPVLDMEIDENRLLQLIDRNQDIINEFHPLKFRDDDEEEEEEEAEANEREEQRISKVLEDFQKKSMKKLERSMIEDAENAMDADSETSDEDDETDTVAATQATQRANESNEREKKAMDSKLKKIWKDYETKISRVAAKDLKEIYQSKLAQMTDIPLQGLTHFPKYSRSILELFSREAIVVLGEKQNYLDPISKMEIKVPLRNKKCGHIYDKDTICSVLKRKKEIACPCMGCSCRSFTVKDLEEDEDLAEKISQSLSKKATSSKSRENSYADLLDSENDDSE